MLRTQATMTDAKSSSQGSLTLPLDLLPDPVPSRVIHAEAQENAVRITTPVAPDPSPRYNIDLQAMQNNIDKLAMADQIKRQALTPRDLYEKACPGLLSIPSDVTDPRQWYSSMSSKSMIKKSPREEKVKRKQTKAKESKNSSRKEEGPGQVAFLVTFPNITKTEAPKYDRTHHRQRSDSESSDKLPPLSHPQSAGTDISLSNIQTQIHIRNLVPHIDDSPYHSARRYQDHAFSDTGSVDSSENIKHVTKKGKVQRAVHKKQKEDEVTKMERQRETIETPPSALDRELTKSMEDILKSVTTCGPETVSRSLRQPPNVSLQLPTIEKETSHIRHVPDETTEVSGDMSRTTSVNWQTGLGLRRTYSYKTLNDYSQPMYPYNEDEMSTRLAKASSNENLAQSSAKFKQLRIPEKRSNVERLKSFRNTYNLRQKSMLKLKMKSGSDMHRMPMNKVQVARSNTVDEYGNVSSKIAPYIEGKLPRYFVVVPDSHGDIRPQEVATDRGTDPKVSEKENPDPQRSITEELQLPGTSFSQLPNDDSSEKNTLISKSGDATSRKSLKDGESTEREKRQSRSRSKSRNRSKSRSRSRNSNDRHEGKKQRKGTLSRGSNVSRSRSWDGQSPVGGHLKNRSKSREREPKKFLSEEDIRPQPSARSPSSKTVHIKASHQHQDSQIPPPSRKSFSKPYIPPKLKRHKTKYTDSLDTFIHQQGRSTRAAILSLAVAEKKTQKYRKKQLVRAIDKYLLTKLGDKLFSSEENIAEAVKKPPTKGTQQIHLVENGKRPVFRKMKGLIPFDERGRPVTRGKDQPVVMEEFPSHVYKPSHRPPTFKMDLKQYPPGKPGPLEREYSYDKRNNSVIPSGIERSLTIGELTFKSPDKMSQVANNDGRLSEISSSLSHLHVAPPKTKHSKRTSHTDSRAGRTRHHKPGGGYVELRVIHKHTSDMEASVDGTSVNDSEASRLQSMTPADSITASMMKEIYENLEDYLEDNKGGQYLHEGMKQRELVMEG